MFAKKLVLTVTIPLSMVCLSSQGNQFRVKDTGQTLVLESGMLLLESDMFVGRDDASGLPMYRGLGLNNGFSNWTNGIVPYQFHSSMNESSIEVARQAIQHWNDRGSITLTERDPSAPDAAIDFVEFVKGPGCASWVGRQGQAQEIWVSDFCTTGSIIHEVGHALGLLHEHTRADRDEYIHVFWENIQEDKSFNFEINRSGTLDLGAYDYASIMHYGEYFFSSNGEPSMLASGDNADAQIGQRTAASDGDLAAIGALYATDLELGTHLNSSDTTTDVSFTVSNLLDNGAHGVTIEFNTDGAEDLVVSSDSDNVSCPIEDGLASCSIGVVAAGSSANVTVIIPGVLSESALDPRLISKTLDVNAQNNGLGSPEMAAANPSARGAVSLSDNATATSSGGGAVAPRYGLFVLLMFLLLRDSVPVIAFATRRQIRRAHASSGSTTSCRGTSR